MKEYLWREKRREREYKKKKMICMSLASLGACGVAMIILLCFVNVFSDFLKTCSESTFLKTMFMSCMILFVVGGFLEAWFDEKLWNLFFVARESKKA